jgi:Tol biopolymer transport system component/DNA-binding winged helix-turn-helix (wHTH) protein
MSEEFGRLGGSRNIRDTPIVPSETADRNRHEIYEFGPFRLEPAERKLLRGSEVVALTPKVFDMLVMLVRNNGHLLDKEELIRALWPDSFVEEGNLSNNIFVLRKALGTDHGYIETVPRRGYRFGGAVLQLPRVAPTQLQEAPSGHRELARFHIPKLSQLSVGVALAVLIAVFSFLWLYRSQEDSELRMGERQVSEPIILPAISLPGDQGMPALSADGSRLAFVLNPPQRRESGIFTAVLGTQGLVVRITKNEWDCSPAWSPDGRDLAFLRFEGGRFNVMIVSSLGGQERAVFSGNASSDAHRDSNIGLSFSPDGKLLAFPEWHPARQSSITAVSLQDLSQHSLTSPPPGLGDGRPVFSPDGRSLAFVRSSEDGYSDELFVAPKLGGESKQLTFDHRRIFGPPSWASDGREIVFSSNRAGLAALWRIPASGGVPRRVPSTGPGAWYPSVSASGGELAYENVDEEENLWRIALRDPRHASSEASIVIPATKTDNFVPQFSPDGRRIAFQSGRSGYQEIWISNADGSDLKQATDLQRFAGSPRWSPEGRYIAFDFRRHQHSEIDILDTMTGRIETIAAFPTADNVIPSWSRDGHWVYFASNLRNGFQIWRVAINDGVAQPKGPIQITWNGGYTAFESMDGSEVLYTKNSQPGIWATTLENGHEHAVWRGPGPDYWSNWALAKDGIFFLAPEAGAPPEIDFLELKTGRVWHIARLAKPSFYGFTVSPDERSLIYSQFDRTERSILLAKNFR